jgi:quercetin dioxygenase-like cupin family protein
VLTEENEAKVLCALLLNLPAPPVAETAFIFRFSRLKDGMSSKRVFPLLTAFLVLTAIAADMPPGNGVIHLDHQKVAEAFAKGGPLLATNNFKVMALRRDKSGEVEIHDSDTDIFYVLEGSANLVIGGNATEPRNTSPGETRAKSITGGEARNVTRGDVVVIPNGVPHWFKEVKPPFLYYMVKVSR